MTSDIAMFSRLTQWIARTAFRMNGAMAVLLGMGVILLVAVPPLATVAGIISQPYPDLKTYFLESVKALPAVVISVLVLGGAVIGVLFQYRYWALDSDLDGRVYCVSLLPLAVLYFPWAILASLKIISHPSCGFVPATNRPAWLDAWPIALFGSPIWFPLGLVAWWILGKRASNAIRQLASGQYCKHCFYDLTGNVSGTCPECGTPIEQQRLS